MASKKGSVKADRLKEILAAAHAIHARFGWGLGLREIRLYQELSPKQTPKTTKASHDILLEYQSCWWLLEYCRKKQDKKADCTDFIQEVPFSTFHLDRVSVPHHVMSSRRMILDASVLVAVATLSALLSALTTSRTSKTRRWERHTEFLDSDQDSWCVCCRDFRWEKRKRQIRAPNERTDHNKIWDSKSHSPKPRTSCIKNTEKVSKLTRFDSFWRSKSLWLTGSPESPRGHRHHLPWVETHVPHLFHGAHP